MSAESSRELGIVKFYNPRKGYGFVARADGTDVFFHLSHFRQPVTPAPGSAVRFALGQNREGLTADDIVLVPIDEVERYGGEVTSVDGDWAEALTPDNFAIRFKRGDFIPHTRADSLRPGDEVELFFLVSDDEASEQWRATVVRAADFDPDTLVGRRERREGDDDEENRRLLGILYKTDLDDEALHAAGLLVERNMRASLSALVSRVFDRRLEPATRRGLVDLIPQLYFDDECQDFLNEMADRLESAIGQEDEEQSPASAEAVAFLLDDARFPVRWSQYLLPFGLTLLRNLAGVPSCHAWLEQADSDESAEQWLTRVCRHVEQRRSGHGYVMTTALTTFDSLHQRHLLARPLAKSLARLLLACDAEGLANQIYHLREKVSPEFLPLLLGRLGEHPDLGEALRAPAQREIFSSWIESLLGGEHELSTAMLAGLLPVVEELRRQISDEETLHRLLRPVTENLTPDEVVRMLTAEDLPERAVWACLRHLDREGELGDLLADPEMREQVVAWLRRTADRPVARAPGEGEMTTALRLIDSLRERSELSDELRDIGRNLFRGIHDRFSAAGGAELVLLLEEFDLATLPGIVPVLARRLCDPALPEPVRGRLLNFLAGCGAPSAELAGALAAWQAEPDSVRRCGALISCLEAAAGSGDADAAAMAEVAREAVAGANVAWHDGFVAELAELPDGTPGALIEGFAILLPKRLFCDEADFALNRHVRLLHRRGMALGVVSAPLPRGVGACGRLAGPLAVDERNAIVGSIIDPDGARCFFEAANVQGEVMRIRTGDLLRFSRVPAVGDQPYQYVAYEVSTEFGGDDTPLLLAAATGSDEPLASAATAMLGRLWAELPPEGRDAVVAELDDEARERLTELVNA